MLIAPATSSASPPKTTTLASPRAERPAVSAKGTVRPSDSPIVKSDRSRGEIRRWTEEEVSLFEECFSSIVSLSVSVEVE